MPGLGPTKQCKCGAVSRRWCCCSDCPLPSNGGGGVGPNWPPQPLGSFLLIRYDAADFGIQALAPLASFRRWRGRSTAGPSH
jgi:hypothetical protein